jgi:hypothetical protein
LNSHLYVLIHDIFRSRHRNCRLNLNYKVCFHLIIDLNNIFIETISLTGKIVTDHAQISNGEWHQENSELIHALEVMFNLLKFVLFRGRDHNR